MKSVLRLVIVLVACTAVIGGVVFWQHHHFKPTVTTVTPEMRDTNGKNTVQEITKSPGTDVADVPSAPVAEQTDDEDIDNIKESSAATTQKVKGKMMPKRTAEKATRDEARKKRLAELETEKAEMKKLVEGALSRSEIYENIFSPILNSQGEVKLSKAEREAIISQIAPLLVEQLNALSADEQFEIFKKLFSMAESAPEFTNDEMESAKHTVLSVLQKHGFEQKFEGINY